MVETEQSNYLQGQIYVANGGCISTAFGLCVLSLTGNLRVLPRVSASN